MRKGAASSAPFVSLCSSKFRTDERGELVLEHVAILLRHMHNGYIRAPLESIGEAVILEVHRGDGGDIPVESRQHRAGEDRPRQKLHLADLVHDEWTLVFDRVPDDGAQDGRHHVIDDVIFAHLRLAFVRWGEESKSE